MDTPLSTSWPVARSGPIAAWAFLRILGAVYGIAFLSLLPQIDGLIGPRGIVPAGEFLEAVRRAYGTSAYWFVPTVFWWSATTRALLLVCGVGALALHLARDDWGEPTILDAIELLKGQRDVGLARWAQKKGRSHG